MAWLTVVILFLAAMLLGVAVAYRLGPRMGIDMERLTPAKKRRLALILVVGGSMALLIVWALSSDHVAIAIGLVLATTVLPEFVLVPLRIKRARRKAEESRAARSLDRP